MCLLGTLSIKKTLVLTSHNVLKSDLKSNLCQSDHFGSNSHNIWSLQVGVKRNPFTDWQESYSMDLATRQSKPLFYQTRNQTKHSEQNVYSESKWDSRMMAKY